MLLLPVNWNDFDPPAQPCRTSYDTGYEHSLEHLLAVLTLVEREATGERSAAAA